MKKLDETAKRKISGRIAEVEKNCESELVCLITRQSARYILFPLLITAIFALFMPIIQPLANAAGATGFVITFQHQTIVFVVLAALFVFTPLGHMLTPAWIKQQNCARYSTEQFFSHKLHETASRNAILIFVSWDERFVTIVADKGINERVQQSDWDGLIAGFVTQIKAGELERGFLDIIGGAGDLLTQNFPVTAPKTDELPNHLIALEGAHYVN
ncbi:TPM domain-containing protein [Yoonia sp. F2084L]|uniref:TPM domain-containing protein n=1 Tax=Yoonia sp. F2084L TaxID=2926419 RepID=UPI001FF2718E|nr:TPM domain-containing protein [Yoonia sp. F2084L]MCK0095955.1 TPM domain-containing protein [Yoonia sp. F2084L]